MARSDSKLSVLFVCLGNICRSPLAEGAFREHLRKAGLDGRIAHDSAGTGHWHVGEPPDPRAVATAAARGVDISDLRARQIRIRDFEEFDRILAMDRTNLADLAALAQPSQRARIALFRGFDPRGAGDVPDPYGGGQKGFDLVFDMVDRTAAALVASLAREIGGERAAESERR